MTERWAERIQARIERGRQANVEVADLADRGIALAEVILEARDGIPPTREELVRGQAIVQAVHTVRWAWALLFAGGEIGANALARLTCEFVLLFWYALAFPDRGDRWLEIDYAPPGFRRMWSLAGRRATAEDPGLAMLPVLYTHLSRTAHSDPLVFAYSFRWRANDPDFFPPDSPLYEHAVVRGAEVLLPITLNVLSTLRRWLDSSEELWWHREVEAYVAKVEAWGAESASSER